jgi:hypothetical protein
MIMVSNKLPMGSLEKLTLQKGSQIVIKQHKWNKWSRPVTLQENIVCDIFDRDMGRWKYKNYWIAPL